MKGIYFRDNLKTFREDDDLTQHQLAAKVGCHSSHISQFETGQRLPSLKNLIKLAQALNCTLDELVFC